MSTQKSDKAPELDPRMKRSYELTTDARMLFHIERPLLRMPTAVGGFIEYQFLPHYFGSEPSWRRGWRFLTRHSRVLPDFAITGPIKSCSSALALSINSHRCVIPPLSKEFFMCGTNTDMWRMYYPTEKEKQRLAQQEGLALCGFFEPFMNWYRLIKNYHQARPDAKIVLMLRDPVARAYSHWKWDILLGGRYTKQLSYYQDFEEYVDLALRLFPECPMHGVCGLPMLQTGIYVKAVQIWIETFGADQVTVMTAENLLQEPEPTLARIQEFIGLPVEPLPFPKLNENPLICAPPSPEAQQKLSRFYQPYNERLFALIGEKFNWL